MDGKSMRLKNRETGEIPEKIETIAYIQWSEKIMMVYINSDGERVIKQYDSLGSLTNEWEECEESEYYYFINDFGLPDCFDLKRNNKTAKRKSIGNYFDTHEEAKQTVEKLQAFKRLKDKGFRFEGFGDRDRGCINEITIYAKLDNPGDYTKYLDILFGGKE